jgi:hypothetical protein
LQFKTATLERSPSEHRIEGDACRHDERRESGQAPETQQAAVREATRIAQGVREKVPEGDPAARDIDNSLKQRTTLDASPGRRAGQPPRRADPVLGSWNAAHGCSRAPSSRASVCSASNANCSHECDLTSNGRSSPHRQWKSTREVGWICEHAVVRLIVNDEALPQALH